MSESMIQKKRWFTAWQDDKEEAWLGEMAKQGYHLNKVETFGKYTFTSGEPRDIVYRLDFITPSKKDESYFQIFRDAGWDYVGELSGWQYWRKEAKPGESSEIFTDPESKIQKYQRLMAFFAILFFPIFMAMINLRPALLSQYIAGHWIEWVFFSVWILVFIGVLIYTYIFIRIGIRINELKKQRYKL